MACEDLCESKCWYIWDCISTILLIVVLIGFFTFTKDGENPEVSITLGCLIVFFAGISVIHHCCKCRDSSREISRLNKIEFTNNNNNNTTSNV